MFEIYRGELLIPRKEGDRWRVTTNFDSDETKNKTLNAALDDARRIVDERHSSAAR